MNRKINAFDYANQIVSQIPKGVLLMTRSGNRVNAMTIGWGALGVEWGKPVFIAYVRESRYSRQLLDENPEFTVSIPMGAVDHEILKVCGTKSGRELDKVASLGLTLSEPEGNTVPGVKELPLTVACKVIYRREQPCDGLPEALKGRYYPDPADPDDHIAYYGEIVGAYLVE